MSVNLLFYRKNIEPNGDVVEMKIWQVPHYRTDLSIPLFMCGRAGG